MGGGGGGSTDVGGDTLWELLGTELCARTRPGQPAIEFWLQRVNLLFYLPCEDQQFLTFSDVGEDLWGLSLAVSIYRNYIFSELTTTENWGVPALHMEDTVLLESLCFSK